MENETQETATLGGGCFWCTEAIFADLRVVKNIVSGYSGGHLLNPAYKQVCSGEIGHAEVVQVKFNPEEIAYKEICRCFCHARPDDFEPAGKRYGIKLSLGDFLSFARTKGNGRKSY